MTLKQAEALPELRWAHRHEYIDASLPRWRWVLQQRWRVPRDPTPESLSATALEWRDVPVVEEESGA